MSAAKKLKMKSLLGQNMEIVIELSEVKSYWWNLQNGDFGWL